VQIELPCTEILLRAILKKKFMDSEGRLLPDAFIRDPQHSDRLSINILRQTDLNAWLRNFSKSFGADTLHAGKVRDIGLDVVQPVEDRGNGSGHALILGIPTQDQDPLRAESLASALAKMSRPLDRQTRSQK